MRRLLVDASVFITLAGIDRAELLRGFDGNVVVPAAVEREIADEPAASRLETAIEGGWMTVEHVNEQAVARNRDGDELLQRAASHLGESDPASADSKHDELDGDVALLALALLADDPILVTDDKPLRKTARSLGITLSGSLGVVIAAVERGNLGPGEAKDALVAMDTVGARLSARLLRRAERLIDEAADDHETDT